MRIYYDGLSLTRDDPKPEYFEDANGLLIICIHTFDDNTGRYYALHVNPTTGERLLFDACGDLV